MDSQHKLSLAVDSLLDTMPKGNELCRGQQEAAYTILKKLKILYCF